MTTPSRRHARTLGLGFGLLAAVLASACDPGPEHDDGEPRLAVVYVADDGIEQSVGSYDVDSGELTFAPEVQDALRERVAGAGYRPIIAHEGDDADIDLDAGVALTTAELEDGDVIELRATRLDVGTSTIARLELRVETDEGFRAKIETNWKEGNITGMDDWEKHNV
jgi:hypothetical protein